MLVRAADEDLTYLLPKTELKLVLDWDRDSPWADLGRQTGLMEIRPGISHYGSMVPWSLGFVCLV